MRLPVLHEDRLTDINRLITIGLHSWKPDLLTEIVILLQFFQADGNLLFGNAGQPVSVVLQISSADIHTDAALH